MEDVDGIDDFDDDFAGPEVPEEMEVILSLLDEYGIEDEDVILETMLLVMVENQLEKNDPPATREHFERLKAEGFSESGAKALIAGAVSNEIRTILAKGEPFDEARFITALQRLPRIDLTQ